MKDIGLRLLRSTFRSRFRLNEKDRIYIAKSGLEKIRSHAHDFILKRLASVRPQNDGHQTPFAGHPVFKAQHATATCCRGCLEKWYGIQKGRELRAEEIEKIVDILMVWIQNKFTEFSTKEKVVL